MGRHNNSSKHESLLLGTLIFSGFVVMVAFIYSMLVYIFYLPGYFITECVWEWPPEPINSRSCIEIVHNESAIKAKEAEVGFIESVFDFGTPRSKSKKMENK